MEITEAYRGLESYDLWLVVLGLGILAATLLPRLLSDRPLSLPILLLALGWLSTALPLGLEAPDPLAEGDIAEHLTEIGVIIAIMGAGLKIDRRFGWSRWASTWRLLGITMIATIAMAAFVGWALAAFVPASAMLLGAVISPTDPVLASGVQVGAPAEGSEDEETEEADPTGPGEEDEVRFALTSESGMNDGLVFPFTNLALLMAIAGAHPSNWLGTWLVMDVFFKIGVAAAVGIGAGMLLARFLVSLPANTALAKSMVGLGALAATLLVYGATEFIGGYGFIATFFAAVSIRQHDLWHEHHRHMHSLIEKAERVFTVLIMVALGASIGGGLLEPLDVRLAATAVLIVFVVRPLAGVLGLIGFDRIPWRERLAISFFGVRGIGSLYYLAFALNEAEFPGAERLWALVGLTLVISILVHGLTAAPVTERLDEMREARSGG